MSGTEAAKFDTATMLALGFAAGTFLRTARGAQAVEALQPGELMVAVRRGGFAPVRSALPRRISPLAYRRPRDVAPVRLRAHAFGPDRPCRDVLLSPGHAVFVDGTLFRAGDLVNGVTIVQEDVATIVYYQVALDRHDVVIADGLPAESFLPIDDRHPAAAATDLMRRAWDSERCAPLVQQGPKLVAARRALAAQADLLSGSVAPEPRVRDALVHA